MKLSEAIRLGSLLSPQCADKYQSSDGSRCALGAALAASGLAEFIHAEKTREAYISQLWPFLDDEREITCPQNCGEKFPSLFEVILHLNDDHFWYREQIAAWAATVEPQEIEAGETVAPETVEVSQ